MSQVQPDLKPPHPIWGEPPCVPAGPAVQEARVAAQTLARAACNYLRSDESGRSQSPVHVSDTIMLLPGLRGSYRTCTGWSMRNPTTSFGSVETSCAQLYTSPARL